MDKQKRKVIHMLLRNHTREFVTYEILLADHQWILFELSAPLCFLSRFLCSGDWKGGRLETGWQ